MTTKLDPLVRRVRTDICWVRRADGMPRLSSEPLTPTKVGKHLSGGPFFGVCPIQEGESTTMVALLDFDSHGGETPWEGMAAAAAAIAAELRARDMAPIPFRSSGGRGIHLFLIWDDPQDCYTVRVMLRDVLDCCGFAAGTRGVAKGEVEVFPKQDAVPPGGCGSMFLLPWAGKSVPLDEAWTPADDATWVSSPGLIPLQKPERDYAPPIATEDLLQLGTYLKAIPNDDDNPLEYDDWRNVIFAIHYETNGSEEGRLIAHEFSAKSPKYDHDFLENEVWPFIDSNRDNPITMGTLRHLATRYGYTAAAVPDDFEDIPADEDPPAEGAVDHTNPFRVQTVDEFTRDGRDVRWLIKGVLPHAALAVLYGAPGSGKTFLALDLAVAIDQGVPWRGCRTNAGRVAYLVAEGAGGFRLRLRALEQHREMSLGLGVIDAAPNFLKPGHIKDLIKELREWGPPDVIVVDTVAQVMAGADENSSEDMGLLIAASRALWRAFRCLVLLIHHSGKDTSKGARGHSSLRGAADVELEVLRLDNSDLRVLTVTKMKDGIDGAEYPFGLTVVPLGQDADGDPVTSCVVDHARRDPSPPGTKPDRRPLGSVEQMAWDVLQSAMLDQGEGLPVETLIKVMCDRLDPPDEGKRDRRRTTAMRGLDGLLERGRVRVDAGKVFER